MQKAGLATTLFSALGVVACGGHGSPPAAQETLNVYNWTGFIAPDTIANFERETGIKVLYDTYESDEVLETKLLTGAKTSNSAFPSEIFLNRPTKRALFASWTRRRC